MRSRQDRTLVLGDLAGTPLWQVGVLSLFDMGGLHVFEGSIRNTYITLSHSGTDTKLQHDYQGIHRAQKLLEKDPPTCSVYPYFRPFNCS